MDATWAWLAGMTMGGFLGVLLGQWMTWLLLRNPLRLLARLYAWIWRETLRLSASRADVAAYAEARVNSNVRC